MARRAGLAFAAVLLLAGCFSAQPPQPLDTAKLPAIRLNVQSVETASKAQYASDLNFIARRRSEQLANDALGYLHERVQAAGGTEFARATVVEASLIDRARAKTGGMLSLEPGREMVGVLALRLVVVDGFGIEGASATARVQIIRPLSDSAGVETKDAAARQLANDLVQQAGAELEKSARQNLGSYLAP